jgi:general secretion pathway protein I
MVATTTSLVIGSYHISQWRYLSPLPLPISEDAPTPLPPTRTRFAQGFTLLEVLIAFVIAGLALSALYALEMTSLQGIRTASRYEQAVSRANSHLALATRADPLTAGDWHGDDGSGFEWHLTVRPISSIKVQPDYRPTSNMADNFGVTLYAIAVQITWHDGRVHEVRLDTEQIGTQAQ